MSTAVEAQRTGKTAPSPVHACLRILEIGGLNRRQKTSPGLRMRAEATVFRPKRTLGGRLTARTFGAEIGENGVARVVADRAIQAAKAGAQRPGRSKKRNVQKH